MSYMFSYCTKLNSLPDISTFNTINVKNMSSMFSYSKLNSLPDISKWNMANVNKKSLMFFGCSKLTNIPKFSK